MESGDRAPETLKVDNIGRTSIRLVAASVFLIAVAFVQSPGKLVSDTKFDLVANPAKFLGSALHLWDPDSAFGQVQNQAYGYLWPMGPFFWIGHELGIPGWVIQRSWLALVLVVAFLGASLIARELGLRSDAAVILAGLCYALSPRMLTDLGAISIEIWPMALAPWVLLPLMRGSKRGSPALAAAWSAFAIGLIGGVNAAAASAVLPMGVLWLLTRSKGPRRRSLMLWWPLFTLMATLWWLVPLFLLGRFSPPFLDYIETAQVTTLSTPLFDSLRGTSNWVPYVDSMARAGNDLVTTFYAPLNSGLLLLFGVLGLLLPRVPERRFLVSSLLTGLVLVSSSHLGALQGWFAGDLNHLLDGALSALRNVHKFDPIVRLPMVIALAWVFEEALAASRKSLDGVDGLSGLRRMGRVGAEYMIPALIVMVSVGAAAPAFLMRVTPTGDMVETPPYWSEATTWLEKQVPPGTTLLAPGTSFGTYLWGSPRDEPIQFLSTAPWAVRNSIPLAPPGNIRMLNAIQERFEQGRGSLGMADYLRRSGIRFILVRNDLQKTGGLVDPVLTHQALDQSPGITRVNTFGPVVGGFPSLDKGDHRVVINQGWQTVYPALEVFEVSASGGQFSQSEQTPVVIGGPETLLSLSDDGLLQDQPTVLGFDAEESTKPSGPVILTDGMKARVREIGSLNQAYSSVLTVADLDRFLDQRDYLPEGSEKWRTWATYQGIKSLTASSSAADSGKNLAHGPNAAMDADQDTSWESSVLDPKPWLRVALQQPESISEITISTPLHSPDPQLMRVETQNGTTKQVKLRSGIPQAVLLPEGETEWIKVLGESDNGFPQSISEVDIPGVTVSRSVRTPKVPTAWGAPDAIFFEGDVDRFAKCANVDLATRCADRGASSGEEDTGLAREVHIPTAADYELRTVGQARPGTALDELIQAGRFVNVMADSVMVDDPRGSAIAAIDGNPGTTWIASPYDKHPTYVVSWLQPRRISGIHLSLQEGAPARLPTSIELSWAKANKRVELIDGSATFPAIRTNQLSMRFTSTDTSFDLGFDLQQQGLGIGFGGLSIDGLPGLDSPLSDHPLPSSCGAGPQVKVGEQQVETAVLSSPADLLANKPVSLKICGEPLVEVPAGTTSITAQSTPEIAISALSLVQPDFSIAAAVDVKGRMTSAGQGLEAHPVQAGGVLVHRANTNPGWVAEQGASALTPIVVDGWQQGWKLRSDQQVTAKFWPDRIYRAGMAMGAVAFGGLILILFVLRRRNPGLGLEPLAMAATTPWVDGALVVLAFGLIAGWWGLLAAVGGAVGHWILDRSSSRGLVPWVLSLPILVGAVGYSVMPWGSTQGWMGEQAWPHFLVMVSLGAVAWALLGKRPDSRGDAG